jgi:hypothetical protein
MSNPPATGIFKAVACVLWADERVAPEEIAAARPVFERRGLPWDEAKTRIEQELELLYDEGEESEAESEGAALEFGVIDTGHEEPMELLTELAVIACADGVLDWQEIEVLHAIGRAMNQSPVLVTAATMVAASGRLNIALGFEEAR